MEPPTSYYFLCYIGPLVITLHNIGAFNNNLADPGLVRFLYLYLYLINCPADRACLLFPRKVEGRNRRGLCEAVTLKERKAKPFHIDCNGWVKPCAAASKKSERFAKFIVDL